MTAVAAASSSTATPSTAAPTSASETAATLQRLLKRSRKHRSNERDDAARLDALRRTFAALCGRGELVLRGGAGADAGDSAADDADTDTAGEEEGDAIRARWNAYLKARHGEFRAQLAAAVRAGRQSALRTYCGVVAATPRIEERGLPGRDNGNGGTDRRSELRMVDERLLQDLLDSLVSSSASASASTSSGGTSSSSGGGTGNENGHGVPMEEAMLNLFDGEFLRPHRDVQYFALLAIKQLAGEIYQRSASTAAGAGNGNGQTTIRDEEGAAEAGTGNGTGASSGGSRDGQRAENLLRILLRVDIAGSDEELASEGAFLIAPPTPPNDEEDDTDADEEDDDQEEDDDGEDNGSEEESSSESSDDNDDDDDEDGEKYSGIGQKRKRTANAHAKTSRRRRRRQKSSSSSSSSSSSNRHRPTWQQATKHRRALQEAWLAVLKIPALPHRALKRALQHLPTAILPVVSAPLRFADVCTRSYEVGGVTSLLALHSLFVLMMDHGLEYPQFYASLYRLVTPRNFYAKHRTRFFRLLANCLSKSDMLPAYVVAAFCKRLCRCALMAPPSGALFVLALVSNLLRRHGECACLVHRSSGGGAAMLEEDRYDADAQDPARSRALESSLWELAALGRHFHPAVAGLAKSVGTETDKTPMHDMDEFLLHTYKSLFETERKRMDPKARRQKAVPVTFEKPPGLFAADDVFAGILSVPRGLE